MKTLRTLVTAFAIVGVILAMVAALRVMPTLGGFAKDFAGKLPWKQTTTTTLPHFDSGNLRVNQFGASDRNGQYSLQPGTRPGMRNVVPVIP